MLTSELVVRAVRCFQAAAEAGLSLDRDVDRGGGLVQGAGMLLVAFACPHVCSTRWLMYLHSACGASNWLGATVICANAVFHHRCVAARSVSDLFVQLISLVKFADLTCDMQGMIEALAPLIQSQRHGDGGEVDAQLRTLWSETVDGIASVMARDESMRLRLFTMPVLSDAEPPPALPGREVWAPVAVSTFPASSSLRRLPPSCTWAAVEPDIGMQSIP